MAITGISLGGLASGLDTESMIQSLLAVEGQAKTRLTVRESAVNARKDALNDVLTRLKNLKTAASDLRSVLSWGNSQTVESSNPALLGVRQTGSVVSPGAYRIDVSALANPASRVYDYVQQGTDNSITIAGSYSYTVTAGSTVDKIMADINADSAAPVYVNKISETQLAFTSRATGASTSAAVTGAGAMMSQVSSIAGGDAAYRIDGNNYSSSSNVVTDIAGLEITLKGFISSTTSESVSVSAPAANTGNVKAKIKAYVEQYNSTLDFINTKLKEEKVPNPQTTADARKGVLFGDSSLTALMRQLRQSATDVIGSGNPAELDQLAELGISTGTSTGSGTVNQDALKGKLVLDEAKLDNLLSTNLEGVKRVLGAVTGVDGFAQKVETLLDGYTRTDGTLGGRIGSMDSELKRLKQSMERLDDRLAASEKRWRAQFSRLESLMAGSQAQGSWLSGQLAALNR